MDKKELEKINILCEFLNDLASQLVKKIKENRQEQNKKIIEELYEVVEDLKKTIEESGEKMPKIQMATSPMMSQIKQYKIKVQPTKLPEFPKKFSLEEAADIIDILLRITEEIKKKDLKVNLVAIEDGLWRLQEKLVKEIDGLKKTIPKIPKLELPMEKGRIKVILPEDQVIRTSLGERISKVVKGVFMGGEPANQSVSIRRADGQLINPATEEDIKEIKNILNRSLGLSGSSFDNHIILQNSYTAYKIIENPPSSPYTLIISNVSDVAVYFRFSNNGVSNGGIKIVPDGSLSIDFAGGETGFLWCESNQKRVNISYKII